MLSILFLANLYKMTRLMRQSPHIPSVRFVLVTFKQCQNRDSNISFLAPGHRVKELKEMIYDQLLLLFQIPEDMGREVGLDCGLPF